MIKKLNIQILDNEYLISIVGEFNQNLKELEKLTNTTYFLEEIQLQQRKSEILRFSEAINF